MPERDGLETVEYFRARHPSMPIIAISGWKPGQRADYLEVGPFMDFGRGWNKTHPTPDPQDLSSVGVGLRWAVTFSWPVPVRPQFELYWGHRLRKVEKPANTLQDKGLHLQFILAAF